ncbi:glycosyl hydrolase family protein [Aureibaculum marinum]|uniref:Glycosyl hydrolase family protein n=1 Tax=Aureibaculum marinum TaxID=2487930 RepID=A0A3N4P1W0_9FLAO|nr:family 16 glycosylhydrolase [Aureibaculum marinum]RPD93363.1 glycosyl hydrolase family protein [Aureibaculum marinum]
MTVKKVCNLVFILIFPILLIIGCKENNRETSTSDKKVELSQSSNLRVVTPASDPDNKEGWVLNEEISDEFEGTELDTTKWFVQGQNGNYYIWKGRAPSQYVPHNVSVENGILKLKTQWEPDYSFAKESYADGAHVDTYGFHEGKPLPVTTAAIVGKKRFLNGYMEVKSKAPEAAITAAFWAIGYEQELDVYEQMGVPKIAKEGSISKNTNRTAVHDWSPPAVRPTKAFGYDEQLPYVTSDDFHVYGVEWGEAYLNIYRDGKFVHGFTQDELGIDWVLNNPMEIWLDSEIFKWLGVPHKEELPATFEVEYVRVWQKPSDNLLAKDKAFYGFEGPILFENNPRPFNMVPEDSKPNDYQKFWLIDKESSKYFQITEGHYASGVESLQFLGYGKNDSLKVSKVVAKTPEGALRLPSGDFKLSINLWLNQGRIADKIYVTLGNPEIKIVFDGLKKLPRRQWVTVEKKFSRLEASTNNDGMVIEIRKEDLPKTRATNLFIDDIEIKKSNK